VNDAEIPEDVKRMIADAAALPPPTRGDVVHPPEFLLWCPPQDGGELARPTEAQARAAAADMAGRTPGVVAAVYRLVGYSYLPIAPAPFTVTLGSTDGN